MLLLSISTAIFIQTICINDYRVIALGQCNIPNCDSCSSSDLTCTRCVSGFYPYFATCTACSKGCESAIDVTATITRQETRATSVVITARVRATGQQEAVLEGVGKGTGELAAKMRVVRFAKKTRVFTPTARA